MAFLASLVRWWYQRERAWWRRVQLGPVFCVAGRPLGGGGRGEQPLDLRDGQRDHPRVWWRGLVRSCWRRCLGIGAVAQLGGGDGADGQGDRDQHGVPGDRGVEADLGLIQPETVLAELECSPGSTARGRV